MPGSPYYFPLGYPVPPSSSPPKPQYSHTSPNYVKQRDMGQDDDKKAQAGIAEASPRDSQETLPVYKKDPSQQKDKDFSLPQYSASSSDGASKSSNKGVWDKLKKVGHSKETPEERQKRKEEYERLQLRDKTIFGQAGGMRLQ